MSTRNVVLTDHQNQLIDTLVSDGRYQNASEAMRAGLRLLEAEETAFSAIKDRLSESVRQAETGEFASGTPEEIFDRALERAKDRQTRE